MIEMAPEADNNFVGREQVLRNWGQILAAVPDIAVEARWVTQGDTVRSEWEMRGTRGDGSAHLIGWGHHLPDAGWRISENAIHPGVPRPR